VKAIIVTLYAEVALPHENSGVVVAVVKANTVTLSVFKRQLVLIKCASCQHGPISLDWNRWQGVCGWIIDKTTHWQMAAGRTANQWATLEKCRRSSGDHALASVAPKSPLHSLCFN